MFVIRKTQIYLKKHIFSVPGKICVHDTIYSYFMKRILFIVLKIGTIINTPIHS
jgi:hypothetical protein